VRFLRVLPRVTQRACLHVTGGDLHRESRVAFQHVVDLGIGVGHRQVHRQVQCSPLSPIAIHRGRAVGLSRASQHRQDRPGRDQHVAVDLIRLVEGVSLGRLGLGVDDLVMRLRADGLCRWPGGRVIAAGAELAQRGRLVVGVVIFLVVLHLRFLPDRPKCRPRLSLSIASPDPKLERSVGTCQNRIVHQNSDSVRSLT
jgi:hypothetical protein